jgi:hypothetical protein
MDTVQQLICCHYDLYISLDDAAVSLPLLLALLAALTGNTTQQQLAAAASPLLAAAAQHRFLQALDPEAGTAAAAAVAILTAKLAGAAAEPAPAEAELADSVAACNRDEEAVQPADSVRAQAADEGPAAVVQPVAAPGIFDMLKFRDFVPRRGTASLSGSTTTASAAASASDTAPAESSGGRTPGMFGIALDKMHELRQRQDISSEQARGQGPDAGGNPWWRVGRQQPAATPTEQQQQQQSSAGRAGMRKFWRPAGPASQQAADCVELQSGRCPAGPIAEGLLRSDSDEALEAACRAMEQTGGGSNMPAPAAQAVAASAHRHAGTIQPLAKAGTGTSSEAAAGAGVGCSTAGNSAQIGSPVVAEGKADSIDSNLVIRTKLVYESADGSSSTCSPVSSRRSTVHSVGSYTNTPTAGGMKDSCSSSGSLAGLQAQNEAAASKHGRTGSMGALDGVLSRFGRQRLSSTATLDGAASDEYGATGSRVEAGADGMSVPLPAQQLTNELSSVSPAAPVAAPAAAGPALGSPLWRAKSRHGRVGSCGVLDMWHGRDAEQQQTIKASSSNGDAGTGVTGTAGIAGGHVLGAAAAPSSAARRCTAQDCSWERDAVNAAVAAGVVLEELQRDVQLQVGMHTAVLFLL